MQDQKSKDKNGKLTFAGPSALESNVVLISNLVKAVYVQTVSQIAGAIVRCESPIGYTTKTVEIALQVHGYYLLLIGHGVEHGDFHFVNATLLVRVCQVGNKRVRVYQYGQIDRRAVTIINKHFRLSGIS